MPNPTGSLLPRTFIPLSLGSVLPRGWLRDQLKIQADGLSGNLEEVWPRVGHTSGWLGGKGESWELGPYYLDGLVPLAWLLNDSKLKKKAAKWINWTLSNTGDYGWLGPATDHPDRWWPRAIMLKVLAQYAEAEKSQEKRIEQVMTAYFMHMAKNLPANPLKQWAKFRWGEYLVSLNWLCGRRPCPMIEQIAPLIQSQGYNWTDHFHFFKINNTVRELPNMATHVVNNAMGVKYPGLWSLYSGRLADRSASDAALEMLDRFHGCATGLFTGDEHLAGLKPSRGTELCAVVEYMYSLEVLLSLFGKPAYADRLESIAYNNLPAAFTADMWAHQYDQQANQVLCSIAERDWTNSDEANIFGLEPHYRCCTANFNQGWPKFAAHMWMKTHDNGLAAVALGPSEVSTTIGDVRVRIVEKTDYPFSGDVEFEVRTSASKRFPLLIRIPGWAEGAEIFINGKKQDTVEPGTFYTITRTWKKKEEVALKLPLKPRLTRRYNDSVAVHRGALTFSLKIDSEWKHIRGKKPAADYEVHPISKWNYALIIDSNQPEKSLEVREKSVKMPCFSEDRAPVVITVKAGEVQSWGMEGASAAPPPPSPVSLSRPPEDVELIPYGAAKLRITEFPVAKL
jgi:uncharacterized protein